MVLGQQQAIVQTQQFQCDFDTQSSSFALLRTNSWTIEVLYFPSHRVLTETNHTTNTNPPFLTAFTIRADWSLLSSLPLPLAFICLPSLFSSFHLWRCCQSASETPGFPFHIRVREGMRDRGRHGRERKRVMICLDECSQRESADPTEERLEEVMGVTDQSQGSSHHLSVFSGQ